MGRPAGSRTARPLTPAMFHILLALAGGERHGYAVRLLGVGVEDPDVGTPTQMAVFTRSGTAGVAA